MNYPFVSIVIPCYNSIRTIERNLEALVQLDYPSYEIIYGDQESTDGTLNVIKKYKQQYPEKVRYVIIPGRRFKSVGGGRSGAICEAKGEIIACTDSDTVPRRDWLKKLVEPMIDDPKIGSVGGEAGSIFIHYTFAEIYAEEFSIHNHGFPRGKVKWDMAGFGGLNEAFRKEALDQIKEEDPEGITYFDEKGEKHYHKSIVYDLRYFRGGDDQDVNAKVYKAGWHLYSEPDAIVDHINRPDIRGLLRQWFGWGRAGPNIFIKHFPNQLRIRLFNKTVLKTKFFTNAYLSFGGFHGVILFPLLTLTTDVLWIEILLWIAAGGCFWIFERKFRKAKFKKKIPLYLFFQFVHCACWLAGWFRGAFKYGKPLCFLGPSFDWERGHKVEG